MHSNRFELPDVVLKSFSASGARPHVVLTLTDDAYHHSDCIAKQLSVSLGGRVVRIPQYITEYSIDEYLLSKNDSILHLPFFAQRSKQLLSRLLRIVASLGQVLVIGADVSDVIELKHIANSVDVSIADTDILEGRISNESISYLLERIASSNVDRNVELHRRIGAIETDIFENIILGQLLIRGIDLSLQEEASRIEQESVIQVQEQSSPTEEKVYDEFNVALTKFTENRKSITRSSARSGPRHGVGKQRSLTHGRPNRVFVRNSRSGMFSLFNTLLAAAPHQIVRRLCAPTNSLAYLIEKEDIRRYPYESTPAHLEILILDSSGSMAGRERISYAKGLVRVFVKHSYQSRSYCSLIVARSNEAKVVVTPTRKTAPLLEELKRIPTGGRTPLYDSLFKAINTAIAFKKKEPSAHVSISLLTDGKDNSETTNTSELIRILNRECITRRVFDTSSASSSVAFAENIAASHHIIEKVNAR